eukprot:scaffold55207_cov20-Tisochrysis_lutea.AAC.3
MHSHCSSIALKTPQVRCYLRAPTWETLVRFPAASPCGGYRHLVSKIHLRSTCTIERSIVVIQRSQGFLVVCLHDPPLQAPTLRAGDGEQTCGFEANRSVATWQEGRAKGFQGSNSLKYKGA